MAAEDGRRSRGGPIGTVNTGSPGGPTVELPTVCVGEFRTASPYARSESYDLARRGASSGCMVSSKARGNPAACDSGGGACTWRGGALL